MKESKGYIHSIETLGLLDGPGIRVVVFMQGCYLRCLFCHNPDTWAKRSKLILTPRQLVDEIRKYRPYIEGDGGVTFSGGEPLFQSKFLLETLKLCKKAGINTAIDTAGVGYSKKYLDDILKYTDLIILDIKAINNTDYKKITSKPMDMFNYFVTKLNNSNKKVWIRQVIVPTINDNYEYMDFLREYIKNIKNVERVELLPYHTMAKDKYKKLKIRYKLKNIPDMSEEECEKLEEYLNEENNDN